jgi:hypothetical protein
MPVQAYDVRVLHRFAEAVMDRSGEAAASVKGIALALLGGIVWRAQPGSIEIKELSGSKDNVLWVTIGTKRYAFAYNDHSGEIELRDRTHTGPALHSFSNETPAAEVEAVFRRL